MIGVAFDPKKLDNAEQKAWWEEWQRRADRATEKAIDRFEDWLSGPRDKPFSLDFDNEIWKDLKNWLKEHIFYGKCGYCESPIGRFWGDAEHYRPKGAIKFKGRDGDIVRAFCDIFDPVSKLPLRCDHPGYFWLAYDWRNLVPACQFCNSGPGKNERFDTQNGHVLMAQLNEGDVLAMPAEVRPKSSKRWPGFYYLAPATLDNLEEPLLLFPLNPTPNRNPRQYLKFGTKGTVAPLKDSTLAELTVEVFGLKDEELRIARQKEQESFLRKYKDALGEFNAETGHSKAQECLDGYEAGKHPFSAASLDYYRLFYDAMPKPF